MGGVAHQGRRRAALGAAICAALLGPICVTAVAGRTAGATGERHSASRALVLRGHRANNTFLIRASAADRGTYSINGGRPVRFSGVDSLTMNGVGGHDVCRIVNPRRGLFAPRHGISCNGGNRSGPRRGVLEVVGGRAVDTAYAPAEPGAGTLTHRLGRTVQVIRFTGMAPTTDTTSSTNLTFNASSATNDAVQLVDGPTAGELTIQSANSQFESLTFANKTNVFISANASGDDAVLSNTQSADGLSQLTVSVNDSVTVDFSLLTGVGVSLGASNGTIAVSGAFTASSVSLLANGTVSESGGGRVLATGTLTTGSNGGTTLNGSNTIGGFHATNGTSGNISLVNVNTASPLSVTGISESGGGSVSVNNTGATALTGTVSAGGGGGINLTSTDATTESGGGALSTTGTLTTSSSGGTTLNGSNTVGAFNATNSTSGNLSLTNSAPSLTVTGIQQSGGGAASITNTGGVSLTGAVGATGGGAVNLTSSAALTESGAGAVSTTGNLTTSSAGGTTLAGANAVRGFNATNSTSGSVTLANTASLLTLTGISQAGGGSVAINNAGAIGVTGSVSAVAGGSVFLTSSGALSESGAGAVSTTGQLKTSSAGGQTLEGSNAVGAFDATNTTSGDVTLVDAASPLNIAAIAESGGASAIVKNSGPIVVQGAVSAPSKVSLEGTAFSAAGSGSISAPNLALLDDGSSATTWTVTPTSVTVGAGGAVPYSNATSLTVRGGSGGDTFGVTASPSTLYTLDGGAGSGGTLNYDAQNRTASGSFSPPDGEIDSPTVQPVKFTRMAAVNLLNRADRTLAVTLNGSGTVTGTGGLSCQASCSHSYDRGTAVTLSAVPASGWRFAGWGRDCSGTGVCPVTMSEDRAVTATFVPVPPPPSCSLVPQSTRVRAPAPRPQHGGHPAPPAGILKLNARCDQAANLVLTGKVTATLKPKHRAVPGHKPPPRIKKRFALSRVRVSILAGRRLTLKVKLPKAALTALQRGARESVALVLTATNANGKSVTRTTIPRLTLVK